MTTNIGLPKISIVFRSLARTLIQRQQRGTVLLIVKGEKRKTEEYSELLQVNTGDYTSDNYDYIRLAFKGGIRKLIVEQIPTATADLPTLLREIKDKKFNRIAMPEAIATEQQSIISFIKAQVDDKGKTYHYVAHDQAADHDHVENFAHKKITEDGKEYNGQQYTARIAGILSGLPPTRSATYYVLPDVTDIDLFEEPEDEVNKGKLIVIFDGEKYKIARGVNSLTSISPEVEDKSEDFCKIKIVEAMDTIKDDISTTFADYYVGKVNNSYDNKMNFIATITSIYFKELENDFLEARYDNKVDIDMEANKKFALRRGEDVEKMTDQEIREFQTGSHVYLAGRVKLLDSMEDLQLNITI